MIRRIDHAGIRQFIALTVIFLLWKSTVVEAQQPDIRTDSLYSTVLGEQRLLQIVFPNDYKPGSIDSAEVLYVIDGISDFARMEWGFVQGEGFIPKNMIMVGIPNTSKGGIDHRDRDLTPTRTYPNSGGADSFIAFFKGELMPYIQKKYKTKARGHTLYGGSLGGLFVCYTFLKDPGLFTSYLAVDPSLWWDDFFVNKMISQKLDSATAFHNTLWLAGRVGAAYHFMGVAGLDSILQTKAPAGLEWKCTVYANETHYSTQLKGLWDGLKFSYGGFYASTGGYGPSREIAIKPKRGIVRGDKPLPLTCYNLNPNPYIRYTTNGSMPTRSSAPLLGEETLINFSASGDSPSGNSMLIVKSFCMRGEYDRIDTGFFTIGAALPAVKKPTGISAGGLHYSYYEGQGGKRPNPSKQKPLRSGFAGKDFDLNRLSDRDPSILVLEGWLEIPQEGYYIFECDGGSGFRIFVGDRLLIDNRNGIGQNYMVPLVEGFYPFRVEYDHKKEANALNPVYIKMEGRDDFPIPLSWQFAHT